MSFLETVFIPIIVVSNVIVLFWIHTRHRNLNYLSRNLTAEEREALEDLLFNVNRLSERIDTLEAIYEADHLDQTRREAEELRADNE